MAAPAPDADEKPAQYLTVRLGPDEYGIGLEAVREIVPIQGVTRVPGPPPWVRGVCNLRGAVLPIVDLAVRFGFGQIQVGKRTCFLVLELPMGKQTLSVGIVAESVNNVIDVRPRQIEAAPEIGLRVEVQYVRGLVRAGERFVVLLDVTRIFACEELIEIDEVGATHQPAADTSAATAAPTAEAEAATPSPKDGGIEFF
jgi:purine-binding chemotaxis protein CheW